VEGRGGCWQWYGGGLGGGWCCRWFRILQELLKKIAYFRGAIFPSSWFPCWLLVEDESARSMRTMAQMVVWSNFVLDFL
jgi:hypothetical protein